MRPGRIEQKLGFTVFESNSVIFGYRNAAVRTEAARDANMKNAKVAAIGEGGDAYDRGGRVEHNPFEPSAEIACWNRGHGHAL